MGKWEIRFEHGWKIKGNILGNREGVACNKGSNDIQYIWVEKSIRDYLKPKAI
jgi:hypothetical protein